MAFRPVSKATIASGEQFLYELKAGPAGGLRPPSGRQQYGAATRSVTTSRGQLWLRPARSVDLTAQRRVVACAYPQAEIVDSVAPGSEDEPSAVRNPFPGQGTAVALDLTVPQDDQLMGTCAG